MADDLRISKRDLTLLERSNKQLKQVQADLRQELDDISAIDIAERIEEATRFFLSRIDEALALAGIDRFSPTGRLATQIIEGVGAGLVGGIQLGILGARAGGPAGAVSGFITGAILGGGVGAQQEPLRQQVDRQTQLQRNAEFQFQEQRRARRDAANAQFNREESIKAMRRRIRFGR